MYTTKLTINSGEALLLQLLVNWLHGCQKWERMKLAWAAGPGCSAKALTDTLYASSQPTTQTSQPAQRPKPSTANINPTSRAAATSLAQERHSYMTLNLNCSGGDPPEKNSLFLLIWMKTHSKETLMICLVWMGLK